MGKQKVKKNILDLIKYFAQPEKQCLSSLFSLLLFSLFFLFLSKTFQLKDILNAHKLKQKKLIKKMPGRSFIFSDSFLLFSTVFGMKSLKSTKCFVGIKFALCDGKSILCVVVVV